MFITKTKQGMTLIELVISVAVLSILASMAMPMARNSVIRTKEVLLREKLREIRTAIDRFYDKNHRDAPTMPEEEKYPKNLEQLVQKKYIRKIPEDPVTGKAEWIIISYTDTFDPDYFIADQNPENVYDIRSTSEDTALDGSRYVTW
jgi:general secretion pathway protein G